MKVLLIKQSSLGDVLHCLPAITEAQQALPQLEFSWLIEESFVEIARWHPAVKEVLPIAHRRWRQNRNTAQTKQEKKAFIQQLQSTQYDYILDAQGLFKSAALCRKAHGTSIGLSYTSIRREKLAALFYDKTIVVEQGQHAIWRLRKLFALSLGYPFEPDAPLNYNIHLPAAEIPTLQKPYIVGLHATTWGSKHLPVKRWEQLAAHCQRKGLHLYLPWNNQVEQQRANHLADQYETAHILAKSSLTQLAHILKGAAAVISVDTGLAHLSSALSVDTTALFGATNPKLTRPLGDKTHCLSADFSCSPCMQKSCPINRENPPCYDTITNENIWQFLPEIST